ncbi:hypothetical protein Hsc_1398 [Herbaspirillum seropedicae]|nr:hypothetical protein Hsc_1398 [Herbaspirillum seropedicae]
MLAAPQTKKRCIEEERSGRGFHHLLCGLCCQSAERHPWRFSHRHHAGQRCGTPTLLILLLAFSVGYTTMARHVTNGGGSMPSPAPAWVEWPAAWAGAGQVRLQYPIYRPFWHVRRGDVGHHLRHLRGAAGVVDLCGPSHAERGRASATSTCRCCCCRWWWPAWFLTAQMSMSASALHDRR